MLSDNPSMMTPSKEILRMTINQQIMDFFKNDGHIEEIPYGVSGLIKEGSYNSEFTLTENAHKLKQVASKVKGYDSCLVKFKRGRGYFIQKSPNQGQFFLAKTYDDSLQKIRGLK